MVALIHSTLRNDVTHNTALQVATIASVLEEGIQPNLSDVSNTTVVQILDQYGKVEASSPAATETPALLPPLTMGQSVTRVIPSPVGRHGTSLLEAEGVSVPLTNGRAIWTVVVATSLGSVSDGTTAATLSMVVGIPIILLLVGFLVWLLVGRALRPVEAIRANVADISAGDLSRRVPEPPTDDEIGRLARTMNAMLQRLDAAARRQRRFVSDASHELRSPVAAILAMAEVAIAHPEHADWPRILGDVRFEGERLEHLVSDLLLLAQADEGGLGTLREPVDIDELVLTEADRLRARGAVKVDVHGVTGARALGDPRQLARVVRNLADNAERYATSQVAFALRTLPGWVELAVMDDGPGIPVADQHRVFERFTRLDESRARGAGGAGLGLAIVHEVVTAHGGSVRIEGPPGTQIILRLPSAEPA
jgi:signal transduction histidine kinase